MTGKRKKYVLAGLVFVGLIMVSALGYGIAQDLISPRDQQEQPEMSRAYILCNEAKSKLKYAEKNYKYPMGGHSATAGYIIDQLRTEISAALSYYRSKYYGRKYDDQWKHIQDPLPH